MILPATADRHQGECGTCARLTKPAPSSQSTFCSIVASAQVLGHLLILPFLPGWALARSLWYQWRFPYSVRTLEKAVAAVQERASTVDSYVQGVLRGYISDAPIFNGFAQNDAFLQGRVDGGQLRRGEIAFEEIPTQHVTETVNSGLILWLANRISQ